MTNSDGKYYAQVIMKNCHFYECKPIKMILPKTYMTLIDGNNNPYNIQTNYIELEYVENNSCESVQKCNCDIQLLMYRGCQCGGV